MYIFSAPILITALKIYLLFSKQRDLTIQNLKYLFSGEGGGVQKSLSGVYFASSLHGSQEHSYSFLSLVLWLNSVRFAAFFSLTITWNNILKDLSVN